MNTLSQKDLEEGLTNQEKQTIFIEEGLKAGEKFDRVKNQLKQDVIDFYGEDEGWTRWNKIDHLRPIHILTHFPELQDRLPLKRKDELQTISYPADQKQTQTEYRYENQAIGQGHYFTDLTDCLEAARHASKEHPAETFLIEQFKPQRTPLATLKDNNLDFIPDKPFTVQTAEKTSEDISRLRKSNYGRQPIQEIVKNLTAIAESKCINQPAPTEASLWNAIEILGDLDEKEQTK